LGKNCVLNIGEIDILAKKSGFFADKTIHFVEVKTSKNGGFFFPEDRVNYKKQNKYKRLVEIWLNKNKLPPDYPCQMDIISVSIIGNKSEIKHFESVLYYKS
jgi:Holliday junction resolvase-like predicted endonuclease